MIYNMYKMFLFYEAKHKRLKLTAIRQHKLLNGFINHPLNAKINKIEKQCIKYGIPSGI